jgi:hypothetical protein
MVIKEVKFGSFSGGASKNIKKTSKTGIKAKLSTTVHQLLVHSGGLTPSHHKPEEGRWKSQINYHFWFEEVFFKRLFNR